MNIGDAVNSFDFDYQLAFNKQINSITAFKFDFFINQRQSFLSFNFQTCFLQLKKQTFFVCRFKQAGTERGMNFYRPVYSPNLKANFHPSLRPLRKNFALFAVKSSLNFSKASRF